MRKANGIFLLTVIMGTLLFAYAMHGVDLSMNLLNVEKKTGLFVTDSNIYGESMTPEKIYVRSFWLAPVGFIIAMTGLILMWQSEKRVS